MSKRILLLALGAVLLFGNTSVFANSIPITYNQTLFGPVQLGSIPSPGGPTITDNIIITVTNNTKQTWSDYTICLLTPNGGAFFKPNVVTISDIVLLSNPFTHFSILLNDQPVGNNGQKEAVLLLTGGVLAPGATFKISLDLAYNNTVDVFGTPSVPEPASAFLLGSGLLGLAAAARRARRT
jgi:hypothetical protein